MARGHQRITGQVGSENHIVDQSFTGCVGGHTDLMIRTGNFCQVFTFGKEISQGFAGFVGIGKFERENSYQQIVGHRSLIEQRHNFL